jgi:hypothetical protein
MEVGQGPNWGCSARNIKGYIMLKIQEDSHGIFGRILIQVLVLGTSEHFRANVYVGTVLPPVDALWLPNGSKLRGHVTEFVVNILFFYIQKPLIYNCFVVTG